MLLLAGYDWSAIQAIGTIGVGIASMLIALTTAVIMHGQVRFIRQVEGPRNFVALATLFQSDSFRRARAQVFLLEKKRELNQWTPEEKDAASIVCSNFNTIGVMVLNGLVPKEYILDSMSGSIVRCYDICEGFINQRRALDSEMAFHWKRFEELYGLAKNHIHLNIAQRSVARRN